MRQTRKTAFGMNQTMLYRMAITGIVLAVLLVVYQVYRQFSQDPDILPGDSRGMVAAVEYVGETSRVVLFKPDGTKVEVPGWREGVKDEAPVWRPDGQRLFFTSDREDQSFQIYRFRPGAGEVERRSIGSRSKDAPRFGPPGFPGENASALITSGGQVQEYSPRDGSTRQLLPPPSGSGAVTDQEGGAVDQFSALYERIGESFRTAIWGKDRRFIIATMRREDGEVLMFQDFEPDSDGRFPLPVPVFAGERITFDVSSEGKVTAAVIGFRWVDPQNVPEQYIKNGKAVPPFEHGVIQFDPAQREAVKVLFATTDEETLSEPRYSPDGSQILYTVGRMSDTDLFEPLGLMLAPANVPLEAPKPIRTSPVYEVSWTPDGASVLYARPTEKGRGLFRLNISSGQETPISSGDGDYGFPAASPQRSE